MKNKALRIGLFLALLMPLVLAPAATATAQAQLTYTYDQALARPDWFNANKVPQLGDVDGDGDLDVMIGDDEVQTGLGRTGEKWFDIEHWGVEPDIITCAKGTANGMPMGATVATAEVADSFEGLTISTFGGNPVSCAAALATIEVIEEENLASNAQVVGSYLREKLEELKEKYPLVGDVRGMGLMQGVELVREQKEPARQEILQVFEATRRRGLLIGKGGLYGNVIRIAPPLNTTAEHVDEAVRILDEAFAEVTGQ